MATAQIKVSASGEVTVYGKSVITDSQLRELEKQRKIKEQKKKDGIREEYEYKLSSKKIRAASAIQAYKYKKIFFMCLTVPEGLKHNHRTLNKSLNLFINNLSKNYGLKNYIAVSERQKNGSVHYHILAKFDFNFLAFDKITAAWNSAVNTIHLSKVDAKNSVRFGGKKKNGQRYYYIYSAEHAVKYITKYLSKENKKGYDAKCYFISQSLREQSYTLEYSKFALEQILEKGNCSGVWHNDYCTIYTINANYAAKLVTEYYRRKEEEAQKLLFLY